MKLQIMSDLHIEFAPLDPPATDADIVILAGDVHIKRYGFEWAMETFPFKPVLYVLGNHEYYGEALPKHTNKLLELSQRSNVKVLENSRVEIDDVIFLGTTLWTDFNLFGYPQVAGFEANKRMTDYRKIKLSPTLRKLQAMDTASINYDAKEWLAKELISCAGKKVVVITHHAPSKRSVPEPYQADILSAAYASNFDDFVVQSGAKLWIHGHTHISRDYYLGQTRVICNPRGYPDEANLAFNPGLVIEV